MSKSIDFTQQGGIPITQNLLKYMQDSYLPILDAIAKMGGSSAGNVPIIISGMVVSGGGNTVSDGCFAYNGNIILFTGSTVVPGGGEVALVLITASANTAAAAYFNSSTPAILLDKTAALTHAATVTDATHFPVSALVRFGAGFGAANRESAFSSIAVSTIVGDGGVSGTIYYKKDYTANTVRMKGILTAANAQNFVAAPTDNFYVMGTLPVGYRPASVINALGIPSDVTPTRFKDFAGDAYIDTIRVAVGTGGAITLSWIKPDAAIASYLVNFDVLFQLD